MPARGACKFPKEPDLPDADTAVLAQMVKAKKEVKVYITEAKKFLECTCSDSRHDKIVEKMRIMAKDFSTIVKAYKFRVKK